MTPVLTPDDISFFRENGYIIVKNMLSGSEIEALREEFTEAFEKEKWTQNSFSAPDNIKDLYRLFPHVVNIVFTERYITVIKQLLGEEIICLPESVIHYNRFFDWHKDTTYLSHMLNEVDIKSNHILLQCGYYLQDNMPEGGGLTIIPKSFDTKDQFVNMYFGNFLFRAYFKILKIMGISPFQFLEKNKNPIDLPSKAGDLLIFNNKLDHRATFKRGKDYKPIKSSNDKFAIFNTFGANREYIQLYRQSLSKPNEPYANFLKVDTLSSTLVDKGKLLGFKFCYNHNDE